MVKSPSILQLENEIKRGERRKLNASAVPKMSKETQSPTNSAGSLNEDGNPKLKFGNEVNSRKLDFDATQFFWKNKVKLFHEKPKPLTENKKSKKEKVEPTLDYKGRIN